VSVCALSRIGNKADASQAVLLLHCSELQSKSQMCSGNYPKETAGSLTIKPLPNTAPLASQSGTPRLAGTACTRSPATNAGTGVMGVGAFSGSLRGLELLPIKWRYLVLPTSTPKGHTHRVLRKRKSLGGLSHSRGPVNCGHELDSLSHLTVGAYPERRLSDRPTNPSVSY
jgi:hypothetical protein